MSAAITARQRNAGAVVITNSNEQSGLYKARAIGNYPGLPGISGPELLDRLSTHATQAGAEMVVGRVYNILQTGGAFYVGYGTEVLTSASVIIATGITQTSLFQGEEEFLGRGVSYCATCDGMLFRGKRVCVVCLSPEAEDEASYLESIGCGVVRLTTRDIRINGDKGVTSVTADGGDIACDGVFILRHAVAPFLMLANLEMSDGHIRTGRSGETNVPGVFAAGDCAGAPHQIAKAVGQGQIAALAADEYIKELGVRS